MIDTYLHVAALKVLEHALNTGDVTPCQNLYETVRKSNRRHGEALKAWFGKHCPFTTRRGKWCMRMPGWKNRFDLEGAAKTPIHVRNINYRNMLSENAWTAYAQNLPEAPYVDLLAI